VNVLYIQGIYFSQTQQFYYTITLGQHVSSLLSHHQAFWRKGPLHQHL